ncbi:C-X-C motif chemokine 9-like [Lepisosteus oculatus]|uniref:C-X-C motif chemokine 9-like n=1 Tax=Lepisosteus oculatus TaxID=7918 RepID=UPI0007404E9B|nr:PREDICTED: C-X-C motif chemokine 9-like [Lepisosteus oculatus]
MSTKILLIVTLAVSVALSQDLGAGSSRCLCHRVRDKMVGHPKSIKNLEIYPPSSSCEHTEIIVNLRNGVKYCLDPNAKKIKEFIMNFQIKKASPAGK